MWSTLQIPVSTFFCWFMSRSTNGFCFDRHEEGNAYSHDFDRPPEGVWHTEQQNCPLKNGMSWLQNGF